VLLASLLIPQLKSERARRSSPAHLSIVGSMRFADPDIDEWASWQRQKSEGVLEHLSKPDNWPGGTSMYANTKLLATYAFRELVERARDSDERYVNNQLFFFPPSFHSLLSLNSFLLHLVTQQECLMTSICLRPRAD
jgi:hypothetical protein